MRHRLEYVIVRVLIALVRVMPGPLMRAGGTILGLALYAIDRGHRRIAQRNLATAFPTRSFQRLGVALRPEPVARATSRL